MGYGAIVLPLPLAAFLALTAAPPAASKAPVLSLRELRLQLPGVSKRVRFATPKGWTGDEDEEPDLRSIRLSGPDGVGQMWVVAAAHPSELGEYLTELKNQHPAAAPSPPMAVQVAGIDPKRGERATRFVITGKESGELVMIERGGVIVLFATIVEPDAWPELQKVLARCYPTVEVAELGPRP